MALLILSWLLALRVKVSLFTHKSDRKEHFGKARWVSGGGLFLVVQPFFIFPDVLGGA